MKTLTKIFCYLFSISIIVNLSARTSNSISTKKFNRAVENISREHPRIFLQRRNVNRIKRKIENDQLVGQAFENLKKAGNKMLNNPFPREKDGDRLPSNNKYKSKRFKRIPALGFLYKITGKQKYLEGAKHDMLAIANWSDWYPRAYLGTARVTASLGIGYDWLYSELSKKEREIIRNAIVEKGFKTSFNGQWWVYSNHNWNGVCHGSLTMAALAILKEDDSGMAEKVLKRSLNALPILLKEYGPDGAYPEGGPGYYTFATEYAIRSITALESALGTDFGFKNYDGFMESAKYFLHLKGPTDYYFSYGDNGSGRTKEGVHKFFPEIFWFAAELDDPTLLWHQKPMLEELVRNGEYISPLFFIYQKGNISREKPGKLNWVGQGRTPVSLHRTGWNENATFIGIKGGSPGSNHAHMDIGSFVLESQGERWAIDPKKGSQTSLESKGLDIWNMNQTSDRWKLFSHTNFGHNTLVVDNSLQRVPGKGRIVRHSSDYDFSYTILDMHKVYQGLLGNNPSVRRGIGLYKDGSIIIQDELKAKPKRIGKVEWGMDIQWQMLTSSKVEIIDDNTAILKQNGKEMWFYLLTPSESKIKLKNSQESAYGYDFQKKGTRMLKFNIQLDEPAKIHRLTVYIHPKEKAEKLPEVKSLYDW